MERKLIWMSVRRARVERKEKKRERERERTKSLMNTASGGDGLGPGRMLGVVEMQRDAWKRRTDVHITCWESCEKSQRSASAEKAYGRSEGVG